MKSDNTKKFYTKKIIFMIILSQTLIVLFSGTLFYCLMTADKLPANVYVGETQVGGMNDKAASEKLRKSYEDLLNEGYLEIHCHKDYRIKLSDIDAVFDAETTLSGIKGYSSPAFLYKIGLNLSNSPKRIVKPSFEVNDGKLRMEIEKLSDYVNRDPVNANISLKGGKLTKSYEISGFRLIIDKAAAAVRQTLKNYAGKPLNLEAYNGAVQIIEPKVKLSDFAGIEAVLSTAEIGIKNPEDMESARLAANAVNKVIIQPLAQTRGNEDGAFSFNECLHKKNLVKDKENEGFDLVASALYQAALKAGISADSIIRSHNRTFPQYTQPGLDACVSSDGFDLKISNTVAHKVLIFASVEGKKVIVSLMGRKDDIPKNALLQAQIVQKFSPPLVREENSALLKGETKTISEGKDGLKADVLLNGRTLYTDTYDPVQAVIQIGPGTLNDTEDGK